VLDWDDTLFPTTWCSDKNLDMHLPCPEDRTYRIPLESAAQSATELAREAVRLADLVAIVTLASRPWVEDTIDRFYPVWAQYMREISIPIVYAHDYEHEVDERSFTSESEYLVALKCRAIGAVCDHLGAAMPTAMRGCRGIWGLNILCIGDSEFEREGAKAVSATWVQDYHRSAARLPRTKTIKMLHAPDIVVLGNQLKTITCWLEALVEKDAAFILELTEASGNVFFSNAEVLGTTVWHGREYSPPSQA